MADTNEGNKNAKPAELLPALQLQNPACFPRCIFLNDFLFKIHPFALFCKLNLSFSVITKLNTDLSSQVLGTFLR